MKTLDFIKLDESKANGVIKALDQLLADFQIHYTNLRNIHWNIKGHKFFELHSQFESQYNDAAEKIDEVAERILMLGGVPEHRFSKYLQVAKLKEEDVISGADASIDYLLHTIEHLMDAEKVVLSAAQEAGDEVTTDMMVGYLAQQEKLIWMLVAYKS